MNYNKLADPALLDKTSKSLKNLGYEVVVVKNKAEALEQIKSSVPKGASVMNGSSVTFEQIGYQDYIKNGNHGWNDLHAKIYAESDNVKRASLRKESVSSEYYLGSVHALVSNGEFIVASNTGSQLPHLVFTSANLILAVSTKKIVENMSDAMSRLEDHIMPLEDKHMQELYKVNTAFRKLLVFKSENPGGGRKIKFILIQEDLGF